MTALITLKFLLKRMEVPERELTTENLKWYGEHLAKTHQNHKDFPEAIHLIAAMLDRAGEKNAKIVRS